MFLWTSKNSNKHLFYWLESCPYIKKLKGILPLVKLMKKEAILNLDLMFQNQVNLEIVILKLIINIKEHIQKKILEVILQEFIFI